MKRYSIVGLLASIVFSFVSATVSAVELGYYNVRVTLETGANWDECWLFEEDGTLTTKNFFRIWKMSYAQDALDTDPHDWQAVIQVNDVGGENFAFHGTSRASLNQGRNFNGKRSQISGNGIRDALYVIPGDDDQIVTFVFKGELSANSCMD